MNSPNNVGLLSGGSSLPPGINGCDRKSAFLEGDRRPIVIAMLKLGHDAISGLLLACAVLAGCASSKPQMPSLIMIELPAVRAGADSDIVVTSLRPLEKTALPKLPKQVDRPDLALRLRNTYAPLKLQLPVLPRWRPEQQTAVARSYWEPQSIGAPRGKFTLRLSLPLPFKQG